VTPTSYSHWAGRVASDLTEIIKPYPREMASFIRAAKGLTAEEMGRFARYRACKGNAAKAAYPPKEKLRYCGGQVSPRTGKSKSGRTRAKARSRSRCGSPACGGLT
jgi:hypothetical protein